MVLRWRRQGAEATLLYCRIHVMRKPGGGYKPCPCEAVGSQEAPLVMEVSFKGL